MAPEVDEVGVGPLFVVYLRKARIEDSMKQ